jgi:hypothetical protein
VAGGRPRYLYPVAVVEAEFPVASPDSWFVSFVDCDEEEEGDKTYAGARTHALLWIAR